MQIQCAHCNERMTVPASAASRRLKCPCCGNRLVFPAVEEAADEVAQAAIEPKEDHNEQNRSEQKHREKEERDKKQLQQKQRERKQREKKQAKQEDVKRAVKRDAGAGKSNRNASSDSKEASDESLSPAERERRQKKREKLEQKKREQKKRELRRRKERKLKQLEAARAKQEEPEPNAAATAENPLAQQNEPAENKEPAITAAAAIPEPASNLDAEQQRPSGSQTPIVKEPHEPVLSEPDSSISALADSWRLRTPDGDIYGPACGEEMDEWVEEGRVDGACQLSQADGPWAPATSRYPELDIPEPEPDAAALGGIELPVETNELLPGMETEAPPTSTTAASAGQASANTADSRQLKAMRRVAGLMLLFAVATFAYATVLGAEPAIQLSREAAVATEQRNEIITRCGVQLLMALLVAAAAVMCWLASRRVRQCLEDTERKRWVELFNSQVIALRWGVAAIVAAVAWHAITWWSG